MKTVVAMVILLIGILVADICYMAQVIDQQRAVIHGLVQDNTEKR
jgi:hypothetical protein